MPRHFNAFTKVFKKMTPSEAAAYRAALDLARIQARWVKAGCKPLDKK